MWAMPGPFQRVPDRCPLSVHVAPMAVTPNEQTFRMFAGMSETCTKGDIGEAANSGGLPDVIFPNVLAATLALEKPHVLVLKGIK
jgi:hypothetical protein